MSIRVGDRKLNIPPVRMKEDRKRSGPPLVDISNKARAKIRKGPASDSPSASPLSTRRVQAVESTPDNNCLITSPEASAFMKGLAQEDLAFRETTLVAKQNGYQEVLGFYQQMGCHHPKFQEAGARKAFCIYKQAMMEADPAKKHELVQEVLSHIESAAQDSKQALFLKAACKQMVGFEKNDQKLLEEAADLFVRVDALDPNLQHLALRRGEWRYTLSFTEPDLQAKRELLQEAIGYFSKIKADHPTYQAVSLRLGDSTFQLAFCSADVLEHQKLLREAFNYYGRVGFYEPNFTDVAHKQGKCKFYESLKESDAQRKRQLLTEAIDFFETVCKCYESAIKSDAQKHSKYVEACLDIGVCKQACANLATNKTSKLTLYKEALELYDLARPDHPFYSDIALMQGECKYQQASMSTSPRMRRNLLQEALSFFTKVQDHHPRFKEAFFSQGGCQVEMAALVNTPMARKLYREALECFSKIEPADTAYYVHAQELIQKCHQGLKL